MSLEYQGYQYDAKSPMIGWQMVSDASIVD
mgnify:CR=1 FL=1